MRDRFRACANAAVLTAAFVFHAASSSVAAAPAERQLHHFSDVRISPDGSRVVAIESTDPVVDGDRARSDVVIRRLDGSAPETVALPCAPDPACEPSSPVWSADGKTLAFVLHAPKSTRRSILETDARGTRVRKLLDYDGTLEGLRFSPAGELAVLATAGAHKEIGATQPGAPIVGVIGEASDEQRIAVVSPSGALAYVSPPDLFVYEYDLRPDGGFVGTAAHGNGDDDWWIAHLYAFDRGSSAREIYVPADPQQQIAQPHVSPDGRTVAFIGGLMSDFGSTGGDVFETPVAGGRAVDVTRDFAASATSLGFACGEGTASGPLAFSVLRGTEMEIDVAAASAGAPETVRSFGETSVSDFTRACVGNVEKGAFVRQSFEAPPEIYVAMGRAAATAVTHDNDGLRPATTARSLAWTNEGTTVRGWLLAPRHVDPASRHPLILTVHGGPAAAFTPRFIGRGTARDLLEAGDFLFYPNPRGSFGGGETFARANVKDFGYGDLRDDLAGIDAAEKLAPIDDARLGIEGGSYGGFMSMWAVTQTHRFKASAASAGIANWISYYGENGIDEWMIPYFGASAYDDPAVYRKSSPIEFIKNVTTPTLVMVGQLDVECPAPQSQEYWHALQTLGVPTQLVIYAGEGHGLRLPKDRADAERRIVSWFARYLVATPT
jgi:dipeptidyl aminopeptidase/acylaminoacyl peptidase